MRPAHIAAASIAVMDRRNSQPRGRKKASDETQDEGNANGERGADQTEHDRFSQELTADIALARADGDAHADLSRALGHGHKHDVHHANPSDNEGNRADGRQKFGYHLGLIRSDRDVCRKVFRVNVLFAVACSEKIDDPVFRFLQGVEVAHAGAYYVEVEFAAQSLAIRRAGNENFETVAGWTVRLEAFPPLRRR